MRTGLKIWSISALFCGITLFSCTSETVETEMTRWCECSKRAKADVSVEAECSEMMQKITRKYEFDPEAVAEIRAKIQECQ